MKRLKSTFFNRNCVDVAKDLIGKTLVFGDHQGIITETEAYRGADDPASHAFRGPTPRSAIMFGPPGYSYIYFIYGMYHCLNIVTEAEGSPSAVLIRGIHLLTPPLTHLNGPGKLCRHLGLTLAHSGIDLTSGSDFFVGDSPSLSTIIATPRIGIKKATDKLWRFIAYS